MSRSADSSNGSRFAAKTARTRCCCSHGGPGDATNAWGTQVRNCRALQELNEVGTPPYKDGKGFAVQRKWANLFEGGDVFIASMLGFALVAPGYLLGDINLTHCMPPAKFSPRLT